MIGRTIAIGDIHGCRAALDSLLTAIQPSLNDTLVALGDFIDRGPESRQVIDRLISLSAQCRLIPILGNHEEMLLAAWREKPAIPKWLECGGIETLRSYGWLRGGPPRPLRDWFPKSHQDFIAGGRDAWETSTHIFVHAGLLPDVPLDRQPAAVLRWRVTSGDSAQPHMSGKITVVGHTPQFSGDVLDLGFLKCIDSNCVRGGWLTALDVGSGRVWQTNHAGQLRAGP